MHRALARLRSAVATLLLAVMVIVPVADAFVCSFESDAHHATADHTRSSPQDEAGKGDVPDGSHAACAHNHCHHAAAERAPLFDMADTQPLDGSGHARPANDVAPSTSADGLKRPPRG